MSVFDATGPEETRRIAAHLAEHLKGGDTLCISGELGSGKTLFAKALGAALGVREEMTSPSFTLVATYPIPQADDPESQANAVAPARHVVHIDLYRMASEEEVDLLGLEEYFTNDRIVLVEWPERARDLLPAACIEVDIVATGATRRRISISRRDEAAP